MLQKYQCATLVLHGAELSALAASFLGEEHCICTEQQAEWAPEPV